MKDKAIIDVLIGDIKTDLELLETADDKIQTAKEEKREVTDRLKEYRRDLSVLIKYAPADKLKEIEQLGFEVTDPNGGLNAVASLVHEIIVKAKDNQMSNEKLYQAYVATFKNPKDAFSYSEFNIKCRGLFNSQRLLRKKGKDPKSSKDDIISLNGVVVPQATKDLKK